MFETPTRTRRMWPLLGLICAGSILCGCGQRGPLYMPDRNARVVTRAANSSAPPATPSSAPSSAPH
ncbi:MAG TPA: lipoprotein [Steroidobacteraceae bacterium]